MLLLGILIFEDVFRGVIVKDWIVVNSHSVNFHLHNKFLIEHCVKHDHECWKIRRVALHSADVQKKALKEDVLAIIEEAKKMKW